MGTRGNTCVAAFRAMSSLFPTSGGPRGGRDWLCVTALYTEYAQIARLYCGAGRSVGGQKRKSGREGTSLTWNSIEFGCGLHCECFHFLAAVI